MGEKRVKLAGVRKIIGERMLESSNTIPQVWGNIKIEYTAINSFLELLKKNNKKVSMSSLYIKALGIAMSEIPDLNSRLEGDEIVYYDSVNPGIAVSSASNLLVLVLRDVQAKSLFEIEDDFRGLIDKVKNNTLSMDDMAGGTVTISNLNKEKLESFNSIINNNECMIIGVGGISRQAVVLPDDTIAPRDVGTLTVNMNHTIVDGISAAMFLNRMQEILENPIETMLTDEEKQEIK